MKIPCTYVVPLLFIVLLESNSYTLKSLSQTNVTEKKSILLFQNLFLIMLMVVDELKSLFASGSSYFGRVMILRHYGNSEISELSCGLLGILNCIYRLIRLYQVSGYPVYSRYAIEFSRKFRRTQLEPKPGTSYFSLGHSHTQALITSIISFILLILCIPLISFRFD